MFSPEDMKMLSGIRDSQVSFSSTISRSPFVLEHTATEFAHVLRFSIPAPALAKRVITVDLNVSALLFQAVELQQPEIRQMT